MKYKKAVFRWALTLFYLVLHGAVFGNSGDSELKLLGIQLKIAESMYVSAEAFERAVDSEMTMATAAHDVDIVIFPEYTSVFLALIPYAREVEHTETLFEAFSAIQRKDPSMDSIQELFLQQSRQVEEIMDRIWGSLAEKHSVFIIAGTWLAKTGDQLRNRMAMYGPSGKLFYSQDKVFLTDFELDILNLSPGHIEAAKPVSINGYLVGTTICRDTFFPEWNKVFSGVDTWIDIKANGASYTKEEEVRFFDALPARIEESGVPKGLTVCLTGEFLDFFWEGKSFTVAYDNKVDLEHIAPTYNESSHIFTTYSSKGDIEKPPSQGR